jgi:hypothetical protein
MGNQFSLPRWKGSQRLCFINQTTARTSRKPSENQRFEAAAFWILTGWSEFEAKSR